MNVLVTGGTGLVGKALQYISENYNYNFTFLSSKDCDLSDLIKTRDLFKNIKPDYVIHLAANVGGLYKNMHSKVTMLEDNLLINLNVLKCCHEFSVKKCISCLSTCIFPNEIKYPINENMLHLGPPHDSNDSYAYAKRMLEIHSKAYREQYGDNFICIIPTNIYGPYDNYNLEDSHVIPGLIHKCYLSKINKTEFIVRGSGKPLRQFIYSVDLAKLIIWTLEKYNKLDNIILSVNEKEEISIKNVALEIAKCFDYEHMLRFDEKYSDGQYKKTADNSKLMNLYRDFKFTELQTGIKKTVDWFIENYEDCRK